MRFLLSSVCEVASKIAYGVLDTQWVARSTGLVGVGVRSWISSFKITLSGLYGTRPAPVKPPWIVRFVIEVE